MGAWKNMGLSVAFDGFIIADGTITDAGDDPIADLTIVCNPN